MAHFRPKTPPFLPHRPTFSPLSLPFSPPPCLLRSSPHPLPALTSPHATLPLPLFFSAPHPPRSPFAVSNAFLPTSSPCANFPSCRSSPPLFFSAPHPPPFPICCSPRLPYHSHTPASSSQFPISPSHAKLALCFTVPPPPHTLTYQNHNISSIDFSPFIRYNISDLREWRNWQTR